MAVDEISQELNGEGLRIGIVIARFNAYAGEGEYEHCLTELKRLGVAEEDITVCHVPGALEVPFALQKMAMGGEYDALIAFAIFLALVLTFAFAFSSSKLFQNGLVMFLGKLSLPMYLNQYLAIIIVTEVFPNKSHLVTFVLITAIDIAVSIPTLYASKPLLTAIKKSKLNRMIAK